MVLAEASTPGIVSASTTSTKNTKLPSSVSVLVDSSGKQRVLQEIRRVGFYTPSALWKPTRTERTEEEKQDSFKKLLDCGFLMDELLRFLLPSDWEPLATSSHGINQLFKMVVPPVLPISKLGDIPSQLSLQDKELQFDGQVLTPTLVDRLAETRLRIHMRGAPPAKKKKDGSAGKVSFKNVHVESELIVTAKKASRQCLLGAVGIADSSRFKRLTVTFTGNGPTADVATPVAEKIRVFLVIDYSNLYSGSQSLPVMVNNTLQATRKYHTLELIICSKATTLNHGTLNQALQISTQILNDHAQGRLEQGSQGQERDVSLFIHSGLAGILRENNHVVSGFVETTILPPRLWRREKPPVYYKTYPSDDNAKFKRLEKKALASWPKMCLPLSFLTSGSCLKKSGTKGRDTWIYGTHYLQDEPGFRNSLPFFILAFSPGFDKLRRLTFESASFEDWSLLIDALLKREQRGLKPLELDLTARDINFLAILKFLLEQGLIGRKLSLYMVNVLDVGPSFFDEFRPRLDTQEVQGERKTKKEGPRKNCTGRLTKKKKLPSSSGPLSQGAHTGPVPAQDSTKSPQKRRKLPSSSSPLSQGGNDDPEPAQDSTKSPKKKRKLPPSSSPLSQGGNGDPKPARMSFPKEVKFRGYLPQFFRIFTGHTFRKVEIVSNELDEESFLSLMAHFSIKVTGEVKLVRS